MATYMQIQKRVKNISGFVPKTCWIAHIKDDYGLTMRIAKNRINENMRKHPCPANKREAIEDALRYFKMLPI